MTIALVAHTGQVNTATSPAINTTGASIILVFVCTYTGSGAITVTDSKSNTYTKVTDHSSTITRGTWWYAENPTVGSGHTVTIGGGSFYSFEVLAFSGTATASVFDVQNGVNGGGSTTSRATGSVTPGQANSLLVAGMALQTSTGAAINSSFTITDSMPGTGSYFGSSAAYLIQGSASPTNPTWSWTNASDAATAIAVFKPAASSIIPDSYYYRQMAGVSHL